MGSYLFNCCIYVRFGPWNTDAFVDNLFNTSPLSYRRATEGRVARLALRGRGQFIQRISETVVGCRETLSGILTVSTFCRTTRLLYWCYTGVLPFNYTSSCQLILNFSFQILMIVTDFDSNTFISYILIFLWTKSSWFVMLKLICWLYIYI